MSEEEHNGNKEKTVLFYIASFIIAVLLAITGIQTYRVSNYEQQLEQYRNAAQQFTEYQQSVGTGLQSARECISSATGSVYELREGLRELEKIFTDMERDNNSIRNYFDSSCTNFSGE